MATFSVGVALLLVCRLPPQILSCRAMTEAGPLPLPPRRERLADRNTQRVVLAQRRLQRGKATAQDAVDMRSHGHDPGRCGSRRGHHPKPVNPQWAVIIF